MNWEKILIAIDESSLATHAMSVGLDLAKRLNAEPALIYVIDSRLANVPGSGVPATELMEDLRKSAETFLTSVKAKVPEGVKPKILLKEGIPADEVVAAAGEWGASVLIVGTHGRKGISRLVMGSTAEDILRHAPCPVFVVKSEVSA